MTVEDVLKLNDTEILKYIDVLADEYKKRTGKKVCRTCSSSLRAMVIELKNIYQVINFKFKRAIAQYKNKPTDSVSISNSNITDEKAIEFLKTNPDRISLFSSYPQNWKELIGIETVEDTAKNTAIEAEIQALRASYEAMTMKELKAKFPDITERRKSDFIDAILK